MDITKHLTSFDLFNDLPKELRLEIGEMTWEVARHIPIVPVYDGEAGHIQVQAEPVQALQICRESREAALKSTRR
jgi:hypothetical protein